MGQYHRCKDGSIGECHAQPGKCPLMPIEAHFNSAEKCQEFSDRVNFLEQSHFYDDFVLADFGDNMSSENSSNAFISSEQIGYLKTADLIVLKEVNEKKSSDISKRIQRGVNISFNTQLKLDEMTVVDELVNKELKVRAKLAKEKGCAVIGRNGDGTYILENDEK